MTHIFFFLRPRRDQSLITPSDGYEFRFTSLRAAPPSLSLCYNHSPPPFTVLKYPSNFLPPPVPPLNLALAVFSLIHSPQSRPFFPSSPTCLIPPPVPNLQYAVYKTSPPFPPQTKTLDDFYPDSARALLLFFFSPPRHLPHSAKTFLFPLLRNIPEIQGPLPPHVAAPPPL